MTKQVPESEHIRGLPPGTRDRIEEIRARERPVASKTSVIARAIELGLGVLEEAAGVRQGETHAPPMPYVRPVAAPVAEVLPDAPAKSKGSQAARDARAADRRARKAALGCTCPGGHREDCELAGLTKSEVDARLAAVKLDGAT